MPDEFSKPFDPTQSADQSAEPGEVAAPVKTRLLRSKKKKARKNLPRIYRSTHTPSLKPPIKHSLCALSLTALTAKIKSRSLFAGI